MRVLLSITLVLFFVQPGFAKDLATKTRAKDKSEKTIEKKKLGVDQSDFMPDSMSFGLILSYRNTSDQLEEVDKKSYGHFLGLAGTYSFDKHWSTFLATGLSYETYGANVYRSREAETYYKMSNVSLGLVYSKMKPLSFVRRSSNTLSVTLPTSERAQIDEHRMYVSLTNFMNSYSWRQFSIFNRINASYTWNKYQYSYFLNDLTASDWVISNSLGINFQAFQGLGLRASVRASQTHFLNGVWIQSFGNSFSAFSNIWGAMIFASYINSAYPENDQIHLPFHDKYRQQVSVGVNYVF